MKKRVTPSIKNVDDWIEFRQAERERKDKREAAKPKIVPESVSPAPFKFNLGEYVQDRVTGKRGYIVTRTEHISGCVQYWLTDKHEGAAITPDRIMDECRLDRTSLPPLEMPKAAPGCVTLIL